MRNIFLYIYDESGPWFRCTTEPGEAPQDTTRDEKRQHTPTHSITSRALVEPLAGQPAREELRHTRKCSRREGQERPHPSRQVTRGRGLITTAAAATTLTTTSARLQQSNSQCSAVSYSPAFAQGLITDNCFQTWFSSPVCTETSSRPMPQMTRHMCRGSRSGLPKPSRPAGSIWRGYSSDRFANFSINAWGGVVG